MRLLLIRHGDPDYSIDSLTEKGCVEAEALAAAADRMSMGKCFVSPLGRARKTASYTLEKLGKTAETLPWLEEFPVRVDLTVHPELIDSHPPKYTEDGRMRPDVIWDILPEYYAAHPELADPEGWRTSELAVKCGMVPVYDRIMEGFDGFLAERGYVRENGGVYRVTKETTETFTLFCHLGISCVMMSRLWNLSPFTTMQHFCPLPTSVTELVTEERIRGIAQFRALRIGDLSHLMMAGVEPSFAARYAEVYSGKERH